MMYERYINRPVKVAQSYRIDKFTGNLELQHEVVIDGKQLQCRGIVTRRDMQQGVPVEYIDRSMRRDMMDAIEGHIYGND